MKPFITNAFVLGAKGLVVSGGADIPSQGLARQALRAAAVGVLGLALQKLSPCIRIRNPLR